MTRAEYDRRMLGLLTRADKLAAAFLALDDDLRALARETFGSGPMIDQLADEASRRGMTVPQLTDALLGTIASDDLFDAVLGDCDHERAPSA